MYIVIIYSHIYFIFYFYILYFSYDFANKLDHLNAWFLIISFSSRYLQFVFNLLRTIYILQQNSSSESLKIITLIIVYKHSYRLHNHELVKNENWSEVWPTFMILFCIAAY